MKKGKQNGRKEEEEGDGWVLANRGGGSMLSLHLQLLYTV